MNHICGWLFLYSTYHRTQVVWNLIIYLLLISGSLAVLSSLSHFILCNVFILKWSLILIYFAWVWRIRSFSRVWGYAQTSVFFMSKPVLVKTLFVFITVFFLFFFFFACSPSSLWLHGLVFVRSMFLTGAGRICLHLQTVCCSGCHLSPAMLASVGSCQSLVLGD